MPWCERCSKYHAPSAMNEDGTCPVCGEPMGEIEVRAAEAVHEESAPWHFKLLVAATAGYLGWRFIQLFV